MMMGQKHQVAVKMLRAARDYGSMPTSLWTSFKALLLTSLVRHSLLSFLLGTQLNFRSSAAATSKKQRQPGRDASHFKTDEDTGKMVIDEEDEEENEEEGDAVAGDAYRESLISADGMTRGPNGRIKFNKDTKKRRRMEEDMDIDVDMGDADATSSGKKAKRKDEPKLGHEFKAKASHTCNIYIFYIRLTVYPESRR